VRQMTMLALAFANERRKPCDPPCGSLSRHPLQ